MTSTLKPAKPRRGRPPKQETVVPPFIEGLLVQFGEEGARLLARRDQLLAELEEANQRFQELNARTRVEVEQIEAALDGLDVGTRALNDSVIDRSNGKG